MLTLGYTVLDHRHPRMDIPHTGKSVQTWLEMFRNKQQARHSFASFAHLGPETALNGLGLIDETMFLRDQKVILVNIIENCVGGWQRQVIS